MEKYEIIKMSEFEDWNWWFVSRRAMMLKMIPKNAKTVFEIGAGTGKNLEVLKNSGFSVEGLDVSQVCVDIAKKKGIRLHKIGIENFDFRKKYDLILMMDFLEHIENDGKALEKAAGAIAKNGHLLVTVPAFQLLFGVHDKVHHHFRRYSMRELERLLESAGFEIEFISYWNALLFVPSAFVKIINKNTKKNWKKRQESNLTKLPGFFNSALITALKLENFLVGRKARLPFGTSIVCLAKARPQK
ncbi:MAG: class I SAM-dependent methyltransferase [Candidatus ainarchaeum sp.]|nr:class I SAM-dependent methyltransferase [Candidatus ainarchaeum sp.]